MTVGRICCHEVDLAEPAETVRAAAQRMLQRNVGTLVVVDESRQPVGILTDRDLAVRVLAKGLDPEETQVGSVMTEQPRTIRLDSPLDSALAAMRMGNVRRLPVVDPEGSLIGILSLDDVVQHLAQEMAVLGRILEGESPRVLAEP
jgi:CBS domain-containing protein